MVPSEHPIKPPETLSDADLAIKCLENPGSSAVGTPYHAERERRHINFNRKLMLAATLAAIMATASLTIEIVSLLI